MSLSGTLFDVTMSRWGGPRERKRVMRAYAVGRMDALRGRPWAGREWAYDGEAPARFQGNFNAPLRAAYRAGWRAAKTGRPPL